MLPSNSFDRFEVGKDMYVYATVETECSGNVCLKN
jgi:hypothetical protein